MIMIFVYWADRVHPSAFSLRPCHFVIRCTYVLSDDRVEKHTIPLIAVKEKPPGAISLPLYRKPMPCSALAYIDSGASLPIYGQLLGS